MTSGTCRACGLSEHHYHENVPVVIGGVEHLHRFQFGTPYDPKPPVTCEPCLDSLKQAQQKWRLKICQRKGWDAWPFDD